MKLSVVIPVYNEVSHIKEILDRVKAVDIDKEIIVVDDCSNDGTVDFLKSLKDKDIRVYYHPVNKGKGAALRLGFANVSGEVVVVQDADLEMDPQDYKFLIKPIIEGKADVVYGSRFKNGKPERLSLKQYIGNRALTFLSNVLSGLRLTDMETCYKMFKVDILKKISLEENRFGFEPEITAKFAKVRARIVEIPVSGYNIRSYAEGKKLGLKDGFSALRCIIKYNLFRGQK